MVPSGERGEKGVLANLTLVNKVTPFNARWQTKSLTKYVLEYSLVEWFLDSKFLLHCIEICVTLHCNRYLFFRLTACVTIGHVTSCEYITQGTHKSRNIYMCKSSGYRVFSLRSRRSEVVGERENGPGRGRLARGQSFSVKTFDRSRNGCQVIGEGAGNDFRGPSVQALPLPSRVSFSRARFFLCPLLPSACHAGYRVFILT